MNLNGKEHVQKYILPSGVVSFGFNLTVLADPALTYFKYGLLLVVT
jgi:hypothetical protein